MTEPELTAETALMAATPLTLLRRAWPLLTTFLTDVKFETRFNGKTAVLTWRSIGDAKAALAARRVMKEIMVEKEKGRSQCQRLEKGEE